jgi:hypothetical protein
MDAIRRKLRLGAALWLLSQAASLSAFAPMACCDGRHGAAAVQQGGSCHRAPVKARCECRLRSACPGTSSNLLAIFSNHGVLPAPVAVPADGQTADAPASGAARLVRLLIPPDLPPPRI